MLVIFVLFDENLIQADFYYVYETEYATTTCFKSHH